MASKPKARNILQNVAVTFGSYASDNDVPAPKRGTATMYYLEGDPIVLKVKQTSDDGTVTVQTVTVT